MNIVNMKSFTFKILELLLEAFSFIILGLCNCV